VKNAHSLILEPCWLHVIDADAARRQQARLKLAGHRTKLYESVDRFCDADALQGVVLAFDDPVIPAADHLLHTMRCTRRALPVALYSDRPMLSRVVEAMRNGAGDYLQWPLDPQILSQSLERLTREDDRRFEKQQREAAARAAVGTLTRREKEVLLGLIEGLTNKSIGRSHGISERTVEIHRGNMLRKLDCRTAAQAVKIAFYAELGLES
jgi:two-component system response regulator FixJ